MNLPTFDRNRMRHKKENFLNRLDEDLSEHYSDELRDLEGFDNELLAELGGNTTQLNDVIDELKNAQKQNLSQAQLITNVRALGTNTYEFARKVSELIP